MPRLIHPILREHLDSLVAQGIDTGIKFQELLDNQREYQNKAKFQCGKCGIMAMEKDITTCKYCGTLRCKHCSFVPWAKDNPCENCKE